MGITHSWCEVIDFEMLDQFCPLLTHLKDAHDLLTLHFISQNPALKSVYVLNCFAWLSKLTVNSLLFVNNLVSLDLNDFELKVQTRAESWTFIRIAGHEENQG